MSEYARPAEALSQPGAPRYFPRYGWSRSSSAMAWPVTSRLMRSVEPRAAHEGVRHAQVAGADHGVQAEHAVAGRGQDAAFFLLLEALLVQPRHALQRDAGAVERRADLRRPVEVAVVLEEPPGGARAAHVALHRIACERRPLAQQRFAGEQVQLVVDLRAVGGDVGEHPPAARVAM